MMEVKIEKQKRLLEDFISVDETYLQFEKFNGEMSDTVRRLKIRSGDAVAAVVFNNETGKFIFTYQFRYPSYMHGQGWMLELVAGMIENEPPEKAIHREILEEIGYNSSRGIKHIQTFYTSPGISSERIFLYYAQVTNKDKINEGGGLESENEDIKIIELTEQEIFNALNDNKIADAKTIIGLMYCIYNL